MGSLSGPFAFLQFRLFIRFCTPTIKMCRSSIIEREGSAGVFHREYSLVLFAKNFGISFAIRDLFHTVLKHRYTNLIFFLRHDISPESLAYGEQSSPDASSSNRSMIK